YAGYHFDATAHPTLAGLLRAGGYWTGAAVSAYVLRGATGAGSGFEDYDDSIGMVDARSPRGGEQRRPGDPDGGLAARRRLISSTRPAWSTSSTRRARSSWPGRRRSRSRALTVRSWCRSTPTPATPTVTW